MKGEKKKVLFIWPLFNHSGLLRSKSCLRAGPGQNGNIIMLQEPPEPTLPEGEIKQPERH